ncbi:MAG: hypothetical protein GY773_26040, partial [Actinomycetia bacterium]|nr:hypothetical protein [Actinomycetes bacterium]
VLTAKQAAAIAAECRSIADREGDHLDIEWALEGDVIHILQARPITALPVAPTGGPPPKQTWEREDAYFPVPLKPLAYSAWLPYHSEAFSRVTAHFGLPFDRVDHGHWFGRVYNRLVPLGEPKSDHPLPPLPILKLAIKLAPPFRKRMAVAEIAIAEDRPMAAIDAWEEGGREAIRARTRELLEVDLDQLSDHELAAHLSEVMEHVQQVGTDHFMVSFAGMFIIIGQLGMAMEQMLGWEPERVLDLVQGYGRATVAHGSDIDALTRQIESDPIARSLLNSDPRDLLDRSGPGGEALRSFLHKHGHRLITVDLGEPTWAEDPAPLLRMVAARLDQTNDVGDPTASAHAAEEEAKSAITDPDELARFELALSRARKARPYGDESETDVGDILAVARYIALEADRRLTHQGTLPLEGDVFFLTIDELWHLLRGSNAPVDLDRRRAEHRWALANPSPALFGPEPSDPPPVAAFPKKVQPIAGAAMWALRLFQPRAPEHDGDGVRGLAASPGRATGPAR